MVDVERRAVVALLLVAVAVVVAVAWTVAADHDGSARATPVDSCTLIDEPGRYVLRANVTDSERDVCLRIAASDVTVEGNGHAVDGVGAFGSAGVLARPADGGRLSNVTVRNVTASGWDDAIRFVAVDGGRIDGTTVTDSRVGVSIRDVRDASATDVTARGNALHGISVLESGRNLTLADNAVIGNDVYGVHLVGSGVRQGTLVNNVARHNEFGFALFGARNLSLVGNRAVDNRIAGVYLSAARDVELRRNRASGQFYGIYLADRSTGNAVVGNELRGNAVGIRLRSSDDNVLRNNAVANSSDAAVLVIASDDVVVRGTTGSNNARGVSVVRSDDVTVENPGLG